MNFGYTEYRLGLTSLCQNSQCSCMHPQQLAKFQIQQARGSQGVPELLIMRAQHNSRRHRLSSMQLHGGARYLGPNAAIDGAAIHMKLLPLPHQLIWGWQSAAQPLLSPLAIPGLLLT